MVLIAALASTAGAQQGPGEARIGAVLRRDGRLVLTNMAAYTPEGTGAGVAADGEHRWVSLVDRISTQYGVDPALTRAVIEVESDFNPRAVSSKGARGLMQLMPSTGERFGVRDFFDPAENIQGGVRYLKFLLEKFDGILDLTLAAYNAGENLVARVGRVPAIPETLGYVRKVRSAYARRNGAGASRAGGGGGVANQAAPSLTGAREIYRTVDERGVVRLSNVGGP